MLACFQTKTSADREGLRHKHWHTLTPHTPHYTLQEVMLLRTALAGSRKAVGAGIVESGSSNKAALQVSQGRESERRACVLGRRYKGLCV